MQEFLQDDLSLAAMPLFFLAIFLEARWSRRQGKRRYRRADTVASLCMGLFSLLVEILPRLLADYA